MVKQIAVIVSVSECTVTDFFNVVFDNKDTLQEYHRLEGDPAASISPWTGDTRIICFSVPLSGVPDVVKRAIGTSTLTIRETQQKQWHEDGSVIVNSEPVLEFVGGSKFTTAAEFTVQAEGSGCKVSAVVTCEAAGPWGLISTIESIMATQAEKSVAGFLDFCIARCKGEPLPQYASDTEYLEEFLDAAETLSMASSADVGNVWDKQQLQPLLKRLEDNTSALQSTLSSLQSLLQKSPSKAPAASKQAPDPSLSTGGLWLPLIFAFILGCCFGAFWPRTRLTFRHA